MAYVADQRRGPTRMNGMKDGAAHAVAATFRRPVLWSLHSLLGFGICLGAGYQVGGAEIAGLLAAFCALAVLGLVTMLVHRRRPDTLGGRAWGHLQCAVDLPASLCVALAAGLAALESDAGSEVLVLAVAVLSYTSLVAIHGLHRIATTAAQVTAAAAPFACALFVEPSLRAQAIGAFVLLHPLALLWALEPIRRSQRRMAFANAELRTALDDVSGNARLSDRAIAGMAAGFAIVTGAGTIARTNERFFALLGLDRSDGQAGEAIADVVEAAHRIGDLPKSWAKQELLAAVAKGSGYAETVQTEDGRTLAMVVDAPQDGETMVWVEDRTEITAHRHEIEYRAITDPLTQSANRIRIMEVLSERLRNGEGGSILCIGVPRSAAIHETFGQRFSDAVLVAVSRTVSRLAARGDILGRLGGDEFLLLSRCETRDALRSFCDRLAAALGSPLSIEGHPITVSVAIGAHPIDPVVSAAQNVERAGLALAEHKASGLSESVMLFDPAMADRAHYRQSLEEGLRSTLARGGDEFHLVYQPIIDGSTGRAAACEALLRWTHPEFGCISPAEFIPIAEKDLLITEIGEWVVRTACAEAAAWREPLPVSVNLSPIQLSAGSTLATVDEALAKHGLPADRLVLEVTESVLANDTRAIRETIRGIKSLGVGLALDDFGQGYSSLGYIKAFPFDKIKIDKAFVSDVESDTVSASIVRAVVDIANSLDVDVVAEGVETKENLAAIGALGVGLIQGYFFSRPLPAEAFRAAYASGRDAGSASAAEAA